LKVGRGTVASLSVLLVCSLASMHPGNNLMYNPGDQKKGQRTTSRKAESKADAVKARDGLTSKVTWNGREISKHVADDSL